MIISNFYLFIETLILTQTLIYCKVKHFFKKSPIFILESALLYLSGYKRVDEWVVHNHWDSAVTSRSLELLGLVSRHHALFLIVLIAYAALHIFNSLLLVIGALLEKRLMLIPWMVQVRNLRLSRKKNDGAKIEFMGFFFGERFEFDV